MCCVHVGKIKIHISYFGPLEIILLLEIVFYFFAGFEHYWYKAIVIVWSEFAFTDSCTYIIAVVKNVMDETELLNYLVPYLHNFVNLHLVYYFFNLNPCWFLFTLNRTHLNMFWDTRFVYFSTARHLNMHTIVFAKISSYCFYEWVLYFETGRLCIQLRYINS